MKLLFLFFWLPLFFAPLRLTAQQTLPEGSEPGCYLPDGVYHLADESDWTLTKKGNQFTEAVGKNTTVSLATSNPDIRCVYFLEVITSTDPEIKPGFRYISQILGNTEDYYDLKTINAKQGKYLTLLKVKQP